MKAISAFLGVVQSPESDFLAVSGKQQVGSCQWLTDSDAFQTWLDPAGDFNVQTSAFDGSPTSSHHPSPKVLWLSGRPGTGKTVAAGHVVQYLNTYNRDCSFFFFQHNNKKSSVVELLRSLAFQMSEASNVVRQILFAMAQNEERLNWDDCSSLWNSLFLGRLLRIPLPQPHYWVIDALDESSSKTLPNLIHMLFRLPESCHIKVFITSRPTGPVERLLIQEKSPPFEIRATLDQSLKDIEAFLRARKPLEGSDEQFADLVKTVLD
jgi:hypothetical protein